MLRKGSASTPTQGLIFRWSRLRKARFDDAVEAFRRVIVMTQAADSYNTSATCTERAKPTGKCSHQRALDIDRRTATNSTLGGTTTRRDATADALKELQRAVTFARKTPGVSTTGAAYINGATTNHHLGRAIKEDVNRGRPPIKKNSTMRAEGRRPRR